MSVSRSSNASNRAAGFSLLEVLVAITILALALAVLYQAASGATRNASRLCKVQKVENCRFLVSETRAAPLDLV